MCIRDRAYTTGIKEARKIDDLTVEIETSAPNPVLLRQLPNVFIMNKAWSEKNNIAKPQDFVNKASGDPDTSKTAASWFGACIFLIVAATILRSFFL